MWTGWQYPDRPRDGSPHGGLPFPHAVVMTFTHLPTSRVPAGGTDNLYEEARWNSRI